MKWTLIAVTAEVECEGHTYTVDLTKEMENICLEDFLDAHQYLLDFDECNCCTWPSQ